MSDWSVSSADQPKPEDYDFDLDRTLASMVGVRASIPDDAFTAEVLGTERAGNGVLIRSNGVVLTIGYLIVEAESIWLSFSDGRGVAGHVLAYDQESGFGLVQALARVDLPALLLGDSAAASTPSRRASSRSRSSLAIGSTSSTRRSSPRHHTPTGAAPRSSDRAAIC